MFLFRQKSRNQADNLAKNMDYQDNIKKLFGIRVADMDTADKYLRRLAPEYLESVKQDMFRQLIKSKVLHKYRLKGKYLLAIDGSGLQSYDYEPYPGCPHKEYKSGKKVWTTYILEAKIVTHNGFSLSLASEWIENGDENKFSKQDSEQKAFKRLIKRIKKDFPRLPLILLLDGLYPNNSIFNIAKENAYDFLITLKDGNLKSVQEQISDKQLFKQYQESGWVGADKKKLIKERYRIYEDIRYKNHKLYVLETIVEKKERDTDKKEETRFVFISNIRAEKSTAHQLSNTARMRWKIENEGFNKQKNQDYALTHKFSRTSFTATKNYYQLLQIADMVHQLSFKLIAVKEFVKRYGLTIKALIQKILSYLSMPDIFDIELIEELLTKKQQLRY